MILNTGTQPGGTTNYVINTEHNTEYGDSSVSSTYG